MNGKHLKRADTVECGKKNSEKKRKKIFKKVEQEIAQLDDWKEHERNM